MPGRTLTVGPYYFIRWTRMEVEDGPRVVKEVRELRDEVGRPVVYVALQGPDYREPSAGTLRSLRETFLAVTELATNVHVVVLGDGVTTSLQRTALRSIVTLGRTLRVDHTDRIKVWTSVEEVLDLESDPAHAKADVLAALDGAGLLTV